MPMRCTPRFKHRNADWQKYCVYMAVKKYFEGESRHD